MARALILFRFDHNGFQFSGYTDEFDQKTIAEAQESGLMVMELTSNQVDAVSPIMSALFYDQRTGPQIDLIRVVWGRNLPKWSELLANDIKLTFGEGDTLYSKEDTIAEIERHDGHHDDFTELIEAINALPDGVMIGW